MVYTGARLSEMAKRCPRVTTSPESTNSLSFYKTCEGEAGYLARFTYRPNAIWRGFATKWGRGQRRCGLRAEQSHMSDQPLVCSNFRNERNPGSNAQAIPGSNTSGSRVGW
jgi:hypothetical protein